MASPHRNCLTGLGPAVLDKRVTIQSLSQSSDSQGGYTDTWSDVATVWAAVEPLKGYERMQAMQMETPLTHRITMRYRTGVGTKQRILYGSRVFHVKEVLNLNEANAFLRLLAVELQTTT